jgi:hypothetical protein
LSTLQIWKRTVTLNHVSLSLHSFFSLFHIWYLQPHLTRWIHWIINPFWALYNILIAYSSVCALILLLYYILYSLFVLSFTLYHIIYTFSLFHCKHLWRWVQFYFRSMFSGFLFYFFILFIKKNQYY